MRTEKEVFKDLKKMDYKIVDNGDCFIKVNNNGDMIRISKYFIVFYRCYREDSELAPLIDKQEHKLLTELFQIYGWL